MVWIFGKVSNQKAIFRVRNRIRGNLLGVRLFQHNVRAVIQLQGKIFRDTLTYMKYSLLPMLVLVPPVLLILAQTNLFFDRSPLLVGQSTLLKITARDASTLDEWRLQTPSQIEVETNPVRIPSKREIVWRIRPEEPGEYELQVHSDFGSESFAVVAGSQWGQVPTVKTASPIIGILYPGESLLPDAGALESIEILYDPLSIDPGGIELHWLIIFLIVSLLFAFGLKGRMGVEI